MRHPLRLAFVVVGLAAAVYRAALVTGGWLGVPPICEWIDPPKYSAGEVGQRDRRTYLGMRDGEWVVIGIGVSVAGLGLLAWAA